jgi:hypothetical protein
MILLNDDEKHNDSLKGEIAAKTDLIMGNSLPVFTDA